MLLIVVGCDSSSPPAPPLVLAPPDDGGMDGAAEPPPPPRCDAPEIDLTPTADAPTCVQPALQFGTTARESCGAIVGLPGGDLLWTGTSEGDLGLDAGMVSATVVARTRSSDGVHLFMRPLQAQGFPTALFLDGDHAYAGTTDGTITKLVVETGDTVWSMRLPTGHAIEAMASDADGGLYAMGTTPAEDAFAVRLSGADGAVLWEVPVETAARDFANSLAVAADGDLFVSGWTTGDLGGPNAGGWDAFVVRLSRDDGAVRWERQLGAEQGEVGPEIAVAPDGDLFLAAALTRIIDDAVVDRWGYAQKLSADDGAVLWTTEFSPVAVDTSVRAVLQHDDALFVVGDTRGPIGGARGRGGHDLFVVRIGGDGELQWSGLYGSEADDGVADVTMGAAGELVLCGRTAGEFLPGARIGDVDFLLLRVVAGP